MNVEYQIKISNLYKKFRIPKEKKTTLFEEVFSIFKGGKYQDFYALKKINLSISKGEFIGIIGSNGSGKSTLLRIIAGIISPSSGKIYTEGRIISFIELGVGFQRELTAKENVYLYGAVMGMSRREINGKYDSIVKFAGISKFMNTKLKNFSSGMIVRLAFSTAIQTNPEILLLDEVLAVGDEEFQKKSYSVFKDLKKRGVTIVFASHDLDAVEKFCDRTIYLKKGKLAGIGKSKIIINRYRKDSSLSRKK